MSLPSNREATLAPASDPNIDRDFIMSKKKASSSTSRRSSSLPADPDVYVSTLEELRKNCLDALEQNEMLVEGIKFLPYPSSLGKNMWLLRPRESRRSR